MTTARVRSVRLVLAGLLGAALGGCGTTVGRIPFQEEGEAVAKFEALEGALAFWTHLDATWEGRLGAFYEIDVEHDERPIARTVCDALTPSVRVASVVTNLGDHHTARYDGKMRCEVTVPSGLLAVHARLRLSPRPSTLALTAADLLFKQ